MPGKKTHFSLGSLTAALCYTVECERKNLDYNIGEILGVALGGGASGILPDVLEPAEHPNHRSFFHSVSTGATIAQSTRELDKTDLTEKQKAFAKSISYSYLSHLAADGTTPKSLPLLK